MEALLEKPIINTHVSANICNSSLFAFLFGELESLEHNLVLQVR